MTDSWTPFCGSISCCSLAPNDIIARPRVRDVLALLLNSGKEVQTSLFMSTAGESGAAPASPCGRCVNKSTHSFYRSAQVV